MGFFSRLFGTRPAPSMGEETSPPPIIDIPLDADDDTLDANTLSAVLAEIDIESAIEAHLAWRQRLLDYVDGKSSEDLRPEMVCLDYRCQLGQWLNGPGGQRLGHYPAFSILVSRHRYFHEQAAAVVGLSREGKPEQARQTLSGSYRYASSQVVLLLKELKRGLNR